MKEQIKELRVKIDGISQLVKDLDYSHLEVDLTLKHQGESVEEFTKRCHLENLGKKIFKQSNERNECYKSLILAKAWLGKMLGEIGESTPYVNDGNRKTVEDIEPTADTHHQINQTHVLGKEKGLIPEEYLLSFNHIQKVDWLRQEIEKVVNIVKNIYVSNYQVSREFNIARTNSYNHLCEARFFLGFELQRIKEQENGK